MRNGTGVSAYWSSGGDIHGRRGVLEPGRARALIDFYADMARACAAASDRAGAVYCARLALCLEGLLDEVSRWRRASVS